MKEDFVLANHSELRASALLDRLEAVLEIAHLGVEYRIARLQLLICLSLRVELAIKLSNSQPTALARPHRILQGDDENGEDEREDSQDRETR